MNISQKWPESARTAFVYLAFISRRSRGFVVDSYDDDALGAMTKSERGKLFMARVTLRPGIVFSGAKRPRDAELAALHHHAYEELHRQFGVHRGRGGARHCRMTGAVNWCTSRHWPRSLLP